MEEKLASAQIDDIISMHSGWKGELLAHIRKVILAAEPNLVEEVKWKMATRPEGLAVWSHDGILCFAEVWKDNIKLLFPKGAQLDDSQGMFNARLKSKDIRAIEFKEGENVNDTGLQALVGAAVELNESKIVK